MPGEGQEAQDQSQKCGAGLRNEYDRPAVIRIGNRTTNQRKHNHRQDARQANPADGYWLISQRADVPKDGPNLHLGAGDRDQLSEPKVKKATML